MEPCHDHRLSAGLVGGMAAASDGCSLENNCGYKVLPRYTHGSLQLIGFAHTMLAIYPRVSI